MDIVRASVTNMRYEYSEVVVLSFQTLFAGWTSDKNLFSEKAKNDSKVRAYSGDIREPTNTAKI